MAPIPLAVIFKTLGSRAINLPLNALRRKLVKENLFDFQPKVLKESFKNSICFCGNCSSKGCKTVSSSTEH